MLSELEDAKELTGETSRINAAYRWDSFKHKTGTELLSYVGDTVLKWLAKEYQDENIFQPLQISHPDNLKAIIDLLDGLQLTDVNADIKGDAFKYLIDTMPGMRIILISYGVILYLVQILLKQQT